MGKFDIKSEGEESNIITSWWNDKINYDIFILELNHE